MKVSKSMEEIWAIKEKISREISGMTDEQVLQYFNKDRPDWADSLPQLERDPSKNAKSGSDKT
jgi:hypothetical protein